MNDFLVKSTDVGKQRYWHEIYFAEHYEKDFQSSALAKANLVLRELKAEGIPITGQNVHRVGKRFRDIVESRSRGETVYANGRKAHYIHYIYVEANGIMHPCTALMLEVPSNKETVYCYYGYKHRSDEQLFIGVRGHAVARYQQRKDNVPLVDVLAKFYMLLSSTKFAALGAECLVDAYTKPSEGALDAEPTNRIFCQGYDEYRLTIDCIVNRAKNLYRGMAYTVHTYINHEDEEGYVPTYGFQPDREVS